MAKQHLGRNDVEKRLGVSQATLYRMVQNGEIKAHRLRPGVRGSKFFFLEVDVKAFEDARVVTKK